MDSVSNIEDQLQIKQLELNAILGVTKAINENISEEDLYKIYQFTMLSGSGASKLALFVKEEKEWYCKVCFGSDIDYTDSDEFPVDEENPDLEELKEETGDFYEFNNLIPIRHKNELLACVLLYGISSDYELADEQLSFIETFANVVIVAIENKRFSRQQLHQEAMRRELEIAERVQTLLFPKNLPDTDQMYIRASYLPRGNVGGDYYDFIDCGNGISFLCVADVSGKGVPAALLMSNFHAGLRVLVRHTEDLTDIVEELNFLVKNIADGEYFITFFIAKFDLNNLDCEYINSGHNPPLMIKENEKPVSLDEGSTVLGIFDKLPEFKSGRFSLTGVTLLVAYTDGLVETANDRDEQFGAERIEEYYIKNAGAEPLRLHRGILAEAEAFKGEMDYPDDVTLVTCRIEPAAN